MCLPGLGLGGGSSTPTVGAPPPAPPGIDPKPPVFGGNESDSAAIATKRRGRSSLRIDLASGGLGGGTGLNIPN